MELNLPFLLASTTEEVFLGILKQTQAAKLTGIFSIELPESVAMFSIELSQSVAPDSLR